MVKGGVVLILALVAVVALSEDIFLGEDHSPGFIVIDPSNGDDFFYWLFRSRKNKNADPLVFWLTGGPGCSSIVALFGENGPFKIDDNLNLHIHPYSWNNESNIVFVDQPRGTGFSGANSSDFVANEDQVARDFYTFLLGFLDKYPEYKGRELFVTGESYAGHYIPAIGAYIAANDNPDINLVAVAIGNGLVDPLRQYPQYANFAYENDLINRPTYTTLRGVFKVCQDLIKTGIWQLAMYECQLGVTAILGLPFAPRFNVYDIREKCQKPPLCYDFSNIGKFLEREDVRKILGVGKRKWSDCNMAVHTALMGDWMTTLAPKVQYLLSKDVYVLVYSGDKDFICNWRGGEAWVHEVEWAHKGDFNNQNYTDWVVDGNNYGQYKSIEPLTFLRVYEAGHMVPLDQPEASLYMLTRFFKRWAEMKALKKNFLGA